MTINDRDEDRSRGTYLRDWNPNHPILSAPERLALKVSHFNLLEMKRQNSGGVLPHPYTDDPEGYAQRLDYERELMRLCGEEYAQWLESRRAWKATRPTERLKEAA